MLYHRLKLIISQLFLNQKKMYKNRMLMKALNSKMKMAEQHIKLDLQQPESRFISYKTLKA